MLDARRRRSSRCRSTKPSWTSPAPSELHGMTPAKALARFARQSRSRARHHRLDRAVDQQVPGQDRLRSGQAARLCRARHRTKRRAFLAPTSRCRHLRRRQSGARRGWSATAIRTIGDLQRAVRARPDAPATAPKGSRLSRLARGIDARRVRPDAGSQKRVEPRPRSIRTPATSRPLERYSGASSEKVSAPAEGASAGGHHRDAEAQDHGLPPAHPRPLARPSDPACRPYLRGRPRPAAARGDRTDIPADRHRRVAHWRKPPAPTWAT